LRKLPILSVLFFCALNFVFAQSEQNDDNRGEGLIVSLDMSVDAFNTTVKTFAHPEIRGLTAQPHTETRFFISEWEFAKDANASIG